MLFLWGLTVGYIAGCLITKSVWNRDIKKKKEILILPDPFVWQENLNATTKK